MQRDTKQALQSKMSFPCHYDGWDSYAEDRMLPYLVTQSFLTSIKMENFSRIVLIFVNFDILKFVSIPWTYYPNI